MIAWCPKKFYCGVLLLCVDGFIMKNRVWYRKSYRRNIVDIFTEDWDESFLSQLDPATYVKILKTGKVKSTMIYANSHVGCCFWPTKTGYIHKGIGERDILGEIIDLCHKEGLDVIVYYSLIFNNRAYEQHPEWRILDLNGKASREREGRIGRYGVCCPNSPGYREFVLDQIRELCQNYDFEGMWFDMTFWPAVCYCPNCKRRYKEEVGEDMPTIVDWDDPSWVRFQKKREEWLAEFAGMATNAVKKYKPEATVVHQSATVPLSWAFGVTHLLTEHCDFVGGDFYGGVLQQSFICKLYYNLTPNMPFEFITNLRYPNNVDRIMTKPKELIEAQSFLTIAHNGAFLINDTIDPIGTLEERGYRILGEIYDEISKYEKYLGGNLCQDVAIYFSFDSKMSFADNGKKASIWAWSSEGFSSRLPHVEAALGAAEALRTNHIPFGVITKRNLEDLPRHQVVVLPNVLRLSDEEADAVKEYVAAGGSVYASKYTLRSKLSEMLGVTSMRETREKFTYIAPTSQGETLLPGVTKKYPLAIPDSQIEAEFPSKEGIMATITLPYTHPDDPLKFASIHDNPPGVPTDYPAIIYKEFGKGKIIWSSASIETSAIRFLEHRSIFVHMIRSLAREPFSFEADAPGCVEVVLFHKPDEKRYLINIVNFQSEIGMPNVPVHDILLRVKVKGSPVRTISLPDETSIPFTKNGEFTEIKVPTVQTFKMLALDYD